METWSFSESCLTCIEYEFNIEDITELTHALYEWINYKTRKIVVIKAKEVKTQQQVIAIHIYYSRKNPYRRKGNYETSKSYHLYNGNIYGTRGLISKMPKEVKMALNEINL